MSRTWMMDPVLWALMLSPAAAEMILENPRTRLILDQDATWRCWLDKAGERELLPQDASVPLAVIQLDGKSFQANQASLENQTLSVGFAGVDTVLRYGIESRPDWIVFRLETVRGTRPERVTLLQLPAIRLVNLGRRLNAVWDDRTTACLMAAGLQADCRPRDGKFAVLEATTQDTPGPPLEGAAAAVIVCATGDFKSIARAASHAFGLPTNEDEQGTPVKDTERTLGSYWFLSLAETDADRMIQLVQRTGIRQVMLSSGAWCTSPGHYLFYEGRYPRGPQSLQALVARLREHGILTGMHCFASKISKRDPHVTPVPDGRLLRGISASWRPSDGMLETTLAEAITEDQTAIRMTGDLRHWPGSSVVADRYWEGGVDKHREVLIADELVRYERIGPEGRWDTLLGCERGAWDTVASAHAAGTAAGHPHGHGDDAPAVALGAAGVDQQTVADFAEEQQDELRQLADELRRGRYRPSPVRRAWIPKPGGQEQRPLGIPQGAVLSPLLANLYLHPLDQLISEAGFEMVRYAGDFVILCATREEAEQALALVRTWVDAAGLTLHPDKTHIVDSREHSFSFLGYSFRGSNRYPRKKSREKFVDRIRELTPRKSGQSLERTITEINQVTRGWFGYYRHCRWTIFKDMDAMIRRRLRRLLLKRHRLNPQRLNRNQRWPNDYFAECGLRSLREAHFRFAQSHAGNY